MTDRRTSARELGEQTYSDLQEFIRERPLTITAAAAGVGLFLGLVLGAI